MSGRARWELPNHARIVRRTPHLPRSADPRTAEASGRPSNPQRGNPVGERVRSPKQSQKAERNQAGARGGAEPLSRLVRLRGQGNESLEAPACAQVGGDCPASPPGWPGEEELHRSLREGSTSRPVAREDGSLSVSERSTAGQQEEASFAEEAPGDPELQPAPPSPPGRWPGPGSVGSASGLWRWSCWRCAGLPRHWPRTWSLYPGVPSTPSE